MAIKRRVTALSRLSRKASTIRGRCRPGRLAKGCRERTGFAEADLQRDLGDRARGLRQEHLGLLDATGVVIAMGRHAERSLERPAEMICAQPNEARQGGERDMLGDVVFDIRGYDALLPAGEAAACRRFDAARASVAAPELVCQHHAERLAILSIFSAVLDQGRHFDGCFPHRAVFEEQARRQGRARCTRAWSERRFGGIEIEIDNAAARTGLLPLAILMTRRYKGELAFDISLRRGGVNQHLFPGSLNIYTPYCNA